ncbi:MAG: hypothetical protein IKL17_07005 [Alistipes sp.]|nr:hypothetical protein [Alistipes sp.]
MSHRVFRNRHNRNPRLSLHPIESQAAININQYRRLVQAFRGYPLPI